MKLSIFAIISIALLIACTPSKREVTKTITTVDVNTNCMVSVQRNPIYGGNTVTNINKWKTAVAIAYPHSNSACAPDIFCTGVAINYEERTQLGKELIATAAHCLQTKDKPFSDNLKVYYGIAHPGLGAYSIYDAARHPNYTSSGTNRYDVAYILLDGLLPISGTDFQNPITATSTSTLFSKNVTIVGFGETESAEYGVKVEGSSKIVKFLSSPVSSYLEVEIGNTSSSGPYATACFGDSGGPAYIEMSTGWEILGLLSRGSSNCEVSDTYSILTPHLNWIENDIKTEHNYTITIIH